MQCVWLPQLGANKKRCKIQRSSVCCVFAKSTEAVPVLYLQNPRVRNLTRQCVLCICKIHWCKIHRSSVLQCMLCMRRSAAARSKNRFQSFSNVMPYGPISIEWATQNLIHFDLSLHHHQNPAHLTVCFLNLWISKSSIFIVLMRLQRKPLQNM